jgi:hypothetical protein
MLLSRRGFLAALFVAPFMPTLAPAPLSLYCIPAAWDDVTPGVLRGIVRDDAFVGYLTFTHRLQFESPNMVARIENLR